MVAITIVRIISVKVCFLSLICTAYEFPYNVDDISEVEREPGYRMWESVEAEWYYPHLSYAIKKFHWVEDIITELNDTIAESNNKIEQLTNTFAQSNNTIIQMKSTIAQLNEKIAKLQGSKGRDNVIDEPTKNNIQG